MWSWILISEGLLMFNLIWSAFWIADSCYLIFMYIGWGISPGLLCWVKINNNNEPLFKGMGCRTIFLCSRLISRDFCQILHNFMATLKSQKTFYTVPCCWRSAFRSAWHVGRWRAGLGGPENCAAFVSCRRDWAEFRERGQHPTPQWIFSSVEAVDCNWQLRRNEVGESHRRVFETHLLDKRLLKEEVGP